MATRRNLPFEVRLKFRNYTRSFRNFTPDPSEADIDETYLTEYVPCTLEFVALSDPVPSDARLYIDGFDALVDEDEVLRVDDDRVYMPCGTAIQIQGSDAGPYETSGNEETSYPWIPGNYRVEVQWGGRSYHTVLHVRPKSLTYDQLRRMREELEKHVIGLTLDIIRKNQGIGRSELVAALPLRFYQYQLLQKNFWAIDTVLQDVLRKPKQEVRRTYGIVPTAKSARRDHRSYRWANSAAGCARNHGYRDREARLSLVPSSALHYDLPENRWLRRILENLLEMMDEIAAAIHRFSGTTNHSTDRLSEEKQKQLRDIEHIQSRLRAVLSESILRYVPSDRGPLPYTPAMQRDGRYRTLYKFWWDLRNHSQVRVDASFEYQWKRTDLLWEYWTLVRTIRALRQLGFEPISGWIFDQGWRFPERVLIPVIPEGTKIVMGRDEEQIAIYYADRIAHSSDAARKAGSLLYVEGAHNWPDIRLDYIQSGSYEYSVVIEAKYRPARNIWRDDKAINRQSWTKIMNQLQAYRAVSRRDKTLHRAVKEVIAVYPRGDDRPLVYKPWDHITLIRLIPGGPDDHYVKHLAAALEPESNS